MMKMAQRILPSLPRLERGSNPLWIPGVSFGASLTQPRVERIVNDESMPQLLVVILKKPGKPQGYREQSSTLRLGIQSIRVGAANDARKVGECGISQLILLNECVETAARAVVG
jgi:hypothetical protein